MAYNLSAQNPKTTEVVGSFAPIAVGIVALDGAGVALVAVPQLSLVEGVVATSQDSAATAVSVTSTAANAFSLVGTASKVVMWIAWGRF